MSTTIDAAGRVVIPKSVRDAMGLKPGTPIDISLVDGRIEIDFPALEATVTTRGGLPVIDSVADIPPLDDETVRATLEVTRR